MSTPGQARPYDSPVRRARADATRRAILDAAQAEFGRRGYVATSVASLAQAAGVAPETVYVVFGTKLGILEALVGRAVGGDDESMALLDRSWVQDLAADPDRNGRIQRLACEGSRILARRSALDELVAQAAGADAGAASLLQAGRRERWMGQRRLLELVVGDDGLGGGRSLDDAADALFAIGSPEVYRLLVVDRSWDHERFVAWYGARIREIVEGDS
jgi:AcrR family transcriptional regulator